MQERRAEPRLLCSDLIGVRLEGAGPAELTANLEDISPSGACVLLEQPAAPGARISLRLGRRRLRGRVQYCVHHEIGYFAGVRFDSGQQWSRKIYTPKHLLDPARLAGRRGGGAAERDGPAARAAAPLVGAAAGPLSGMPLPRGPHPRCTAR